MNRRSYDLVKGKANDGSSQWSTRSYSLEEITRSFSLPMVIKSDMRSCSLIHQDYRLKLAEQSILLYETRTKHKMVAKHLQYEGQHISPEAGKKPNPAGGEKLILPEDYPGWFVYLKSVGGGVRCFEKIADLAASKVRAFVTGSKIAGLQFTTLQGGKVDYKPRHFLPGTVFRADRIFVGKVRVDAGMKFLLFRKTKMQDVKYLKCRDVQNRDILLALDKVGKFFEISSVFVDDNMTDKYVFNTEELFSLRQIISPVMLIYGQTPRVENFSGILHLQRKFEDKTVVAATNIDRNNHVVLEIAVASSTTYHMALNSKEVIRHGDMGGALKHCRRRADQFVQRIRVPFALSQDEVDEADISDNKLQLEEEELMSRKLTSITESIEEEPEEVEEESDEDNKKVFEETHNANDKASLLQNVNESHVSKISYEKEVTLDDEQNESSQPLNIIDEKTHNDINDSLNANSIPPPSGDEALQHRDKEEEEILTITVEEKLINLNCMSEVMLSTTTTEVPAAASEDSDSDREKMADSDSNDDADSGISEKNKEEIVAS